MFQKTIVSIAAGVLLASAATANPVTDYTYDTAGRLSTAKQGSGKPVSYGYDNLSRLNSETWPAVGGQAGQVGYTHAPAGGLAAVQDPRALTTTYDRNGLGEVGSQVSPDTGTTGATFDEAGNLKTQLLANGAVVTYAYDALNRLTQVNTGDDTVTLAYDAGANGVGKLTSMTNSSGTTTWSYDAHGNVAWKSQSVVGGASLGVRSVYTAGRLTKLTYPSGRVVEFTYDAERVTAISVSGVEVLSDIQYQPMGAPKSWKMGVAGAAGTYTRAFDTAGRIASYTFEGGARTLNWTTENRLASLKNPDNSTWTYGYDAMGRMTSANEGMGRVLGNTLDLNGNLLSMTRSGVTTSYGVSATSNQLTSRTDAAGTQAWAYDANGNLTSDGTRSFTWNNAGTLASATTSAGTHNYRYNGAGQRVKKELPGGAARYYVYDQDGVSLLGEYWQNSAGAPVGTRNEIVYLEGVPVMVLRPGAVYFIQPDHLHTPRLIKDSAGAAVWRWTSDVYGHGLADASPGGGMAFEFNSRMPGQQFDAETGLHYNNARYYDPLTGRYISSDPIGLAGGVNPYLYANGRSTGETDPSGRVGLPGAVVGGVAGVIVSGVVAFASGEDFSKWKTWANIGVSGVAGAVAGASGTYLVPAAASIGRTMSMNALIGGGVNASAGIASNTINCKPLTDGLAINIGAGVLFGAGGAGLDKLFRAAGKVEQAIANRANIKFPFNPNNVGKQWPVFPNDEVTKQYARVGAGLGNGVSNVSGLVPLTNDAFNQLTNK